MYLYGLEGLHILMLLNNLKSVRVCLPSTLCHPPPATDGVTATLFVSTLFVRSTIKPNNNCTTGYLNRLHSFKYPIISICPNYFTMCRVSIYLKYNPGHPRPSYTIMPADVVRRNVR